MNRLNIIVYLFLLGTALLFIAGCGGAETAAPAEVAREQPAAEEVAAVEEPAEEAVVEEVAVEEPMEVVAEEAVIVGEAVISGPIAGRQIGNVAVAESQPLMFEALKPPITIQRLPQLSGYSIAKLADDRVIGSAGVDGAVGLTVSPIREVEIAEFQGVQRGISLGQVWAYSAEQEQPGNFLVALDTDTLNGFMFNEEIGQEIAIDFQKEQLQPQTSVAFEEALPVDVTIRADGACFLLKEESGVNRYCSFDPLLSTRTLLGPDYVAALEEEVYVGMEKLAEFGVFLPDIHEVLVEGAISEMENPAAIAQCHPDDPDSCRADVIVAPILAHGEEAPPDFMGEDGRLFANGLLILREDLDLSDIEFQNDYLDEMGIEAARFLPAGDYVLYDHVSPDGETRPMLVRGRNMDDDFIDFMPLPARLAPFVGPDGDVGIVEIAGFKVTRWCVMWECS